MNAAILVELRFFGTSILWGMLLLIIYDALRIIRRVIDHNAFIISIQDILYWVISSLLIFNMMYQQNNGIIRGFAILAMLLGMLIYHFCFSNPLVDFISGAINGVIALIIKIISILLWPFKFIFKKIYKFITWTGSKLKKLILHLLKPLKNTYKRSKIKKEENQKLKKQRKEKQKQEKHEKQIEKNQEDKGD